MKILYRSRTGAFSPGLKVHMLESVNDLKEYVSVEELSVLVGGKLPAENFD